MDSSQQWGGPFRLSVARVSDSDIRDLGERPRISLRSCGLRAEYGVIYGNIIGHFATLYEGPNARERLPSLTMLGAVADGRAPQTHFRALAELESNPPGFDELPQNIGTETLES